MPYTLNFYAQDKSTGRVGFVLDAIAHAANSIVYDAVDVAVAYATRGGVERVASKLSGTAWHDSTKRFLVSIDFGITEPAAIAELAALPNCEVRVPGGSVALSNGRLIPGTTFHPKSYIFRNNSNPHTLAVVSGSANLTRSALATGAEVVTSQSWSGHLTKQELDLLSGSHQLLRWFDDSWENADPVDSVLSPYEARFIQELKPESLREDSGPAVDIFYAPPAAVEVSGSLAVQLASANSLWVKTGTLYHNRGPHRAGNQLDLPRGTRVFFGFPATNVSVNTIFGEIEIAVPGFNPVRRSVRFGNNMMDKVNLPVPGEDGPSNYDDAYLIFDRTGSRVGGIQSFQLRVADLTELNRKKSESRNLIDLTMSGGRPYGLLF